MVNYVFKGKLHALNKEDSLIYCIHVAKRLWPDYVRFYEIENFGDVFFINDLLEAAEVFFGHHTKDAEKINLLNERLDKVGPDSEDFPSVESTYALNACCCCYDILALLKDHDRDAAARSYDTAVETAYIKLEEKQLNHDYTYEQLCDSAEMKQEDDLHEALLQRIKTGNRPDLIKDTFDLTFRE